MVVVVKNFNTYEEFASYVACQKVSNNLIVIDFTASWCPPCQRMKPIFEKLSDKYLTVHFLCIDVDANEEVTQHLDIKAMPTFQFWKNGKKIESFLGADGEKLEELIDSLK